MIVNLNRKGVFNIRFRIKCKRILALLTSKHITVADESKIFPSFFNFRISISLLILFNFLDAFSLYFGYVISNEMVSACNYNLNQSSSIINTGKNKRFCHMKGKQHLLTGLM
jgi:hypothetical protein